MTLALAGSLLVLALIDSTSFGTLLIPIWFLLAPGRVPVGRILVFLGTVAGFYLGVGVLLLFGLDAILANADDFWENPIVLRGQLVLGVGLFVLSFVIGRKPKEGAQTVTADAEARVGARDAGTAVTGQAATAPKPGRITRWRDRALGQQGSGGLGGLITLALAAALLEVATMLPYLGAIGLLGTSDLPVVGRVGTLAAYCLVMVLPALVLLLLRLVARRQVEPLLQRIARWMARSGAETTAWIVGIVGFLLARDAVARMPELLDLLGGIGS